jgi:ankyrin repeat protein
MREEDELKYYEAIHRLFVAANIGNGQDAQAAIDAGAEVNARHPAKYQDTPLHWAATKGHTEVVRVLLKNGADPTLKNERHETPAYRAAQAGQKQTFDIIEEWSQKGVENSATDKTHSAREANRSRTVRRRGLGWLRLS